jgi:hypothetical protein
MEPLEVVFVKSVNSFKEQVTELTVNSGRSKFRDAKMTIEMIEIITRDT